MAWAGRGVMVGGSASAFPRQATSRCALRFRIKLDGSEPTVVSYKKLLNEVEAEPAMVKSSAPPGANPALEARLAPVGAMAAEVPSTKVEEKVVGDPLKEPLPAPPNRFSNVIEKIEALYKGGGSDDDDDGEGQQNRPYGGEDTDQYDTQDSFIDDADLDAYFQTDKARLKHKGFFVNKGKLEKLNDSSSLPGAPLQKMMDRKRPASKGKEEKRVPKVIAKERVVKKKAKNMIHGKKEGCMGSGDFEEEEGFAARKKRLKDEARFGEADHKTFRPKVMGGPGRKPLGRGDELHLKGDVGFQNRREEMNLEVYRRDGIASGTPNRTKDARVGMVGEREVIRVRTDNDCGVATSGGVLTQQRGWREGGGEGMVAPEDLQIPGRIGGVDSLTARVKGSGGAFGGLFPVRADGSATGRSGPDELRASAASGGGYDVTGRRTPTGNAGDSDKTERRGGGSLKFGSMTDPRGEDGRGGGASESAYNYNRVLKGKNVEEMDDEETESDDDRDFSDQKGMKSKGSMMSSRLIEVGGGGVGKVGKAMAGESLNDGGRDGISHKKPRMDGGGGGGLPHKATGAPRNSPNNNVGNSKGTEKGSSGDDLVLSPVRRGGAPRGTMLERAIRDLEKGVAEMCPPDADQAQEQGTLPTSTQQQQQQHAVKKRLPPGVKEKLAKVARLAAKQGKISSEVIDKLMAILGHRLQLPSLKRNLKEMVALGLSRQQAKEGQLQMSKEDLKQTVALRVAQLQVQGEPLPSLQDAFEPEGVDPTAGGENGPRRVFKWDRDTEEKLWQFVDLYLRDMDEHKGSRLRKLYKELSAMWPTGWMDNKGIKEAIQRVNLRHQQERLLSGAGKSHKKGSDDSKSGQAKRRKAFQGGGGGGGGSGGAVVVLGGGGSSEWMEAEGDVGTSRETVGFRETTPGGDTFTRSFHLEEAEGASGSGSGGGAWQREVRSDVPGGAGILASGCAAPSRGTCDVGPSFVESDKPAIKKKKISLLPVRKKRKVVVVETPNAGVGIDKVPHGGASGGFTTGNSPPAAGVQTSSVADVSRAMGSNPGSRPSSATRVSQSQAFVHNAAGMVGLGREAAPAWNVTASFPVQPGTPPQSQSTGLHEDGRDVTGVSSAGPGNNIKRSSSSPSKQLSPTPIPASA
ncbi:hypothetical protein CBR_g45850 [Chara braunii]|uniref:Hpc2-related domain-containing protein n=1 Tax=Chara braunii TaxID=69332 RepID=A0A388LZG5_CHABU|nr:hypothetical protein CBR_g45850 [Chara braunii]|eukprot:GBG87696.1 hypothetical protein CBR_g45850 [Chara braunii]